jgi:hypothetical protein
LFSTRTLVIVLVASAAALLAALGAGLTTWNAMSGTAGTSTAMVAALVVGGASWYGVFFSVAGALDRLVG